MTKVKICGITSSREIEFLNKYMPDYIGFVFAESRRQVTPDRAASLAAVLNKKVKRVGVFVNADPKYVAETTKTAGLDVLQLHGEEDSRYISQIRSMVRSGTEIWKAFRIGPGHLLDKSLTSSLGADRILLDTFAAVSPGGTGKCFDWGLVSGLDVGRPLVLAGGLSADNIRDAIGMLSPFAVDTSSGVEENGEKSEGLVKEFIKAVRI